MYDTLIKNGLLVLPERCMNGDIAIKDGKIARIAPQIDAATAETIDAAGNYVLPGMVDVHMHISEPGRTEWEGYLTGTKAMVVGGTTAFVEMPLNTIPATMDIASLNLKLEAAKDQCYADYAPMGGLLPWNLNDLKPLSEAGVAAFKAFVATCGSGKPGDFKDVTDYELYAGMQVLAETGATLSGALLRAELVDEIVLYQAAKILGAPARGLFATPENPTALHAAPRWQTQSVETLGSGIKWVLRRTEAV